MLAGNKAGGFSKTAQKTQQCAANRTKCLRIELNIEDGTEMDGKSRQKYSSSYY